MREIHLLSQIKHKNIISYKEVVVQSSKGYLIKLREHIFGFRIHGHRFVTYDG